MSKCKWFDRNITLYRSQFDVQGESISLLDVLFDRTNDQRAVFEQLRALNPSSSDYLDNKRSIKNTLPCFSLNLMEPGNRKSVIQYNGLAQVDLDNVSERDLDSIKEEVFKLPYVCYCGLSCSGKGLFAIACIADPSKLKDYHEFFLKGFDKAGIKMDSTKGANANDLRYISFDSRKQIRDDPIPLRLPLRPKIYVAGKSNFTCDGNYLLRKIESAQVGTRAVTINRVAFIAGGMGISLEQIEQAVISSHNQPEFLRTARKAFSQGQLKFKK